MFISFNSNWYRARQRLVRPDVLIFDHKTNLMIVITEVGCSENQTIFLLERQFLRLTEMEYQFLYILTSMNINRWYHMIYRCGKLLYIYVNISFDQLYTLEPSINIHQIWYIHNELKFCHIIHYIYNSLFSLNSILVCKPVKRHNESWILNI